jgi:hypothetical protein
LERLLMTIEDALARLSAGLAEDERLYAEEKP